MDKIFEKEILKITGEETLLNHSFIINYKEKCCYFYEFEYFSDFIQTSFKPYKIVLTHPVNPFINIFIFSKINI